MSKWTKDLVLYRIEKAQGALKDANILAESERWNTSVNRLYYSCFYAVSALLIQDGLSSSKHTGIRSLFNKHYVKICKVPKELGRIYKALFERRQESDYIDFIDFQEFQVRPWISETEIFVDYIINLIEKKKME